MLQGSLDNFALDEVLALLASSHKTGHLRISGDRGTGSLWVADGDLVGAEASNALAAEEPGDVMFELLRFHGGNFSFIADETAPNPHEPINIDEVVAAGQELIVEWRRIESVIPSLDHHLAPVAELPSDQVMLTNAEWQTLLAVGEGESVGEACKRLSIGELNGCRRLKGIVERGLLSVTDPVSAAVTATVAAEATARESEELQRQADAGIPEPPPVDLPDEARPPMPAPPALGNTGGAAPPPPPAPPSPAEIENFSANLSTTGDLAATPPVPPSPPSPPTDEDPADDEASLLMRYLKSEG